MLIGWTEDGDVLFYSDRGLTEGVWRVPLANGRAVGDPVQVAGDLWGMEPMSIAGETLFYGVTTQVPRIHIQPLDLEANRLAGTPTPVEPHMRRSRAAAWSPDGLRVVYWVAHRDRGGQVSGRLVLRSTTGGDPIDITPPDLNVAGRARWSRDGRGLFLEARPLDGSESGLYYYDLEDGTSEFIFRAPPEINMRTGEVSSDGSTAYLLGNASDGGEALIRVDVDTGEQRELLSHPARSDAAPGILGMGLSPDEQQLAVWDLSDPVGERSLLVLPTDGGEPRLLLKVTSREDELDAACRGYRAPIWTPDGRYVLTTFRNVPAGQSIPPKPCRLHKIPVDGGEPIFVGDLPEYIGRWTLSPDGKRLALEMGETRGEIWMLQGISGHR
jgi:Tol biopolymer transport system component